MSCSREYPGLYLHLPFCVSICPYCDFYVLIGDEEHRERFLRLLEAEMVLCGTSPWPGFSAPVSAEPFDTIYLGGGTPSLIDPQHLQQVLELATRTLPVTERPWIALEANPEDVDASSLEAWRQMGVRFLSLGIQSFDDRKLRYLGRSHDSRTCRASLEAARESGIETVSLDLIYGLPEESPTSWRDDLERALELQPHHLSCYQLTIEPRTPFGFRRQRGELAESTGEQQADLFFLTHRFLAERGFVAYEVSNFARHPEHRSRHNMKYWHRTPYLGLGPSAHSFLGRHRWWNARKIKPYTEKIEGGERPIEGFEELTPADDCLERLMLGLRTPEGVDLDAFTGDTGSIVWQDNVSWIEELRVRELVELEGRRIRPTLSGLALAESIAGRFSLPTPRPPEAAGIC